MTLEKISMLVKRIITDAKEIGYSAMLLDTLPFLVNATENMVFMKLKATTTVRWILPFICGWICKTRLENTLIIKGVTTIWQKTNCHR